MAVHIFARSICRYDSRKGLWCSLSTSPTVIFGGSVDVPHFTFLARSTPRRRPCHSAPSSARMACHHRN
jgi:hypothetical protein